MKQPQKIFLSADIEGTCGISHWDETDPTKPDNAYFARQMTREVAAACQGAIDGGVQELLVRDAHHDARNIDPSGLPRGARVLRGWARDPHMMVSGLDSSFDGVFFTGYHSCAGSDANPLAHTMTNAAFLVTINGEAVSELFINCLTAATMGVPVLLVTGDEGLCQSIQAVNPHIRTVPVNRGMGDATLSLFHPDEAVDRIREAAQAAVSAAFANPSAFLYPLPNRFDVEITYRKHADAARCGHYPGARKTGPRSVLFETADYAEALRFMHFCL
ncbi:MAG: M55 family metallopeptidase [Clostridia bacterium]|nr:M55 family metallopeptidase [Clostridia bacterium]